MTAALNLWTALPLRMAERGRVRGRALYALYSVSDAWLTGGDAGMAAGWGYAICAAIAAGILFRGVLSRGAFPAAPPGRVIAGFRRKAAGRVRRTLNSIDKE